MAKGKVLTTIPSLPRQAEILRCRGGARLLQRRFMDGRSTAPYTDADASGIRDIDLSMKSFYAGEALAMRVELSRKAPLVCQAKAEIGKTSMQKTTLTSHGIIKMLSGLSGALPEKERLWHRNAIETEEKKSIW